MLVRPMLLHHMSLVSFLLFCKNLGNLQEFFGQMVYRPPWPKIARTPMPGVQIVRTIQRELRRKKQSKKTARWGGNRFGKE